MKKEDINDINLVGKSLREIREIQLAYRTGELGEIKGGGSRPDDETYATNADSRYTGTFDEQPLRGTGGAFTAAGTLIKNG